jgi:hypothetical protein
MPIEMAPSAVTANEIDRVQNEADRADPEVTVGANSGHIGLLDGELRAKARKAAGPLRLRESDTPARTRRTRRLFGARPVRSPGWRLS